MEAGILITIGIILLVIGLVSCVLPPLPGPPIAFIALLIASYALNKTIDLPAWLLITYAIITIFILIIDNFIPIWSTKKFGGTKAGIRGCFIGILVGVLFSPFGGISIIICPFLGAMIGEMVDGQDFKTSFKSGIGSFVGFLLTSGIKIILVLMMSYHFFKAVF
ncbi:MAG TPA: DUF456 domain-containing protein [Chitinophagales bacterium]|jgi:uncharacterized protein YqgC (DUF456 family)|nr:DUF456 domain-containing protein [Chitinophagales bacterium]MBP6153458.1 DUF456 domain-containing protein [Chitinophagales bacterium]HQV78077.1 DUF456 domain-containing protein [Chitinophagales bacterium]HQW80084.1 DUF456 domain-containing protein [Chitinophagales bacterium]HRB18704.1 DUF456 domain-containing protein [Chitinophagales bacterium]